MPDSPIYSQAHYLPDKTGWRYVPGPIKRVKGTWEDHLKSIARYCKSQAVIYDNTRETGGTIYHKPNNCNSWDCKECRKKKALNLKSRITAATSKQRWRLLTLTFDPKKVSLNDCLLNCSHSWDVFLKRLKRQFKNIAWFKVLEFQKNGYPHFHVIVNQYIDKRWLNEVWPACGGGDITDIQVIKNQRIARYVSGYLSHKDNKHHERDYQFFVYSLRRFAVSRNFCLRPWEKRTIVFTRGIDWDCSNDMFNDVIRIFYRDGMFYAVNSKNKIKYLNMYSDSFKFKEC